MSGTSKVAGSPRPPRSEGTRRAGPAPGAGGLSTCRRHAGSRSREEEVGEGCRKGRAAWPSEEREHPAWARAHSAAAEGARSTSSRLVSQAQEKKRKRPRARAAREPRKGSRHSGWTLACCLRGKKATSESAASSFSKGQGQVTQVRGGLRAHPRKALAWHRLGKWATVINSHRVRASQA